MRNALVVLGFVSYLTLVSPAAHAWTKAAYGHKASHLKPRVFLKDSTVPIVRNRFQPQPRVGRPKRSRGFFNGASGSIRMEGLRRRSRQVQVL